MKRNIYNLLKLLFLFIVLLLIIKNSEIVITVVITSITIWKNNIFTTLFPFFIISDLLIQYGFVDIISELTKNITRKVLSLPGEASFVIIASLLTGFPSSSKYTKELLDRNIINIDEAEYLLSFTHFPNPVFITGVVGSLLNKKVSLIILISIYIGNLLIAIIFRKKTTKNIKRINLSSTMRKINDKNKSFIRIISDSIIKAMDTLILILGIIIVFYIISSLINKVFSFNNEINSIICGLFEITQRIKKVAILNIPIHIKATIITSFVSFGGISIHMQTTSVLNNPNISYMKYFVKRIIHSIISGFITYLLCLLNSI